MRIQQKHLVSIINPHPGERTKTLLRSAQSLVGREYAVWVDPLVSIRLLDPAVALRLRDAQRTEREQDAEQVKWVRIETRVSRMQEAPRMPTMQLRRLRPSSRPLDKE